ncbi:uncharacterized protein DNG_06017 [Cephalotrichum gorgonifer]|uniref:Gfd2/YDR514C-like C-terminal domain-containing protein n=1 Tax=Cephalotrichum gorgonifer TaxID=2041049 RepID=A0AAE8MZ74_9PEZI|nr:uncharacterized protein DNG_06017 [Cephalotrichum gorgonifer]
MSALPPVSLDLARISLLRAAAGLHPPNDEVPSGLDAKWFGPGIKDLLFVSLDVEAKQDSSPSRSGHGYIFHCGLSVLDTRDLCVYARAISRAPGSASESKSTPPDLDSYHFTVGDDTNDTNMKYFKRRERCRFFSQHHTRAASAVERIRQILGDRPFVLITHSEHLDRQFWNTFHIGRDPLWTMDIVSIIHSYRPLGLVATPSLKAITEFLSIPYKVGELHIAGYDAHYTLKAVLAFAALCSLMAEFKKLPPDFDWMSTRRSLLGISGRSLTHEIRGQVEAPKSSTSAMTHATKVMNRVMELKRIVEDLPTVAKRPLFTRAKPQRAQTGPETP